uniref:Uncharacterized protein n=1 Tax=Arundo donax TaxID=35708 RepID=A0A0A9GCF0_ARUDO
MTRATCYNTHERGRDNKFSYRIPFATSITLVKYPGYYYLWINHQESPWILSM